MQKKTQRLLDARTGLCVYEIGPKTYICIISKFQHLVSKENIKRPYRRKIH